MALEVFSAWSGGFPKGRQFNQRSKVKGAGPWIASTGNRPLVVPGFGRPDGGNLSHVFLPAGALERLRHYAGVRTVNACVRPLPAECLEA